jgi:hypothetical protein
MNESTASYSVTFRMTMSPPTLDLNLKLIRRAQEFADSLIAIALESLHEYEYIAGPIQVQGIESSLTRKFKKYWTVAACRRTCNRLTLFLQDSASPLFHRIQKI